MSEAEVFPSPDLIGEPEWQRLLAAAAHGRFPCRDRAILHLLWDHAATPQQLLGLEAAHVDFLSGGLCWPDGRRSRLSPDVLRLLTAYLSMERHPRCPKLFGGRHGLPLGPADIDRLFRRLSALGSGPEDREILAVYYMILQLGFQGQYGALGEESSSLPVRRQLQAVLEPVFSSGEGKALFPEALPGEKALPGSSPEGQTRKRRIRTLLLWGAPPAVLLILFIVFDRIVHQMAGDVMGHLH